MALVSSSFNEENKTSAQSQRSNWENENLSQIPFKVLRGHYEGVNSCQLCLNGTHILTCSDDTSIKLWTSKGTNLIKTYAGHTKPVSFAKMSADDKKFISCSWDKLLHMWDTETGNIVWTNRHNGIITSCDISADSKYVVSVSDFDNAVKIWNAEDGKEAFSLKDHHTSTPTCCTFSPNSQRIATTSMDRKTKIWDLISQKTTASLNDHFNIVSSCAFSKNERYLSTTSWDKTLRVWDISTGMYRSQGSHLLTKGHEGCVSCCKFSEDSQTLVSGGYDKSVVIWEMQNYAKKLVLKGHDGWITDVDISRDGKWILSSSKDKTVRIWNIEDADHIPVVLENRRAMGLKISQCENCKKMFSIAQMEDVSELRLCVFCRLADPERNAVPMISSSTF